MFPFKSAMDTAKFPSELPACRSSQSNIAQDNYTSNGRKLQYEAELLNIRFGENIYSKFLLRHGRRPDKEEAKVIGVLMGARVKSSDGSMQPAPSRETANERQACKQGSRARSRMLMDLERVQRAIARLIEGSSNHSLLISEVHGSDRIREQIDATLHYLKRFAEEIDSRGKRAS